MAKKKPRKNKKVELTPRKVQDIKTEALGQAMILTLAYLMDEFDYDGDALVGVWEGVARYSEAIAQKLITMQQVCDIINNATGLDIRWNK